MSTRGQDAFTDATARVLSWKRPLLVTHTKPDGDALGSLAAMRAMLHSQGIDALAVLFDSIPDRYNIFTRYEAMPVLGADIQTSDLSSVDGVIVLDTCAYNQLEPLADWLRAATTPKIAVDHHITRDDLADLYVVDESAAANCLILYDWARAADWPLDAQTRDALFIGIAMDTGWFRHSSTNSRVLAAAADLIQGGVRVHELVQPLFLQDTPGRVRLLGAALSRMELFIGGRGRRRSLPIPGRSRPTPRILSTSPCESPLWSFLCFWWTEAMV
ncbi:MAG: DHH family phosphoesterase [Planctomycetota bacterium]|jgi:phosphoesterase RecJ-like protein